jgi:hypothetical protein
MLVPLTEKDRSTTSERSLGSSPPLPINEEGNRLGRVVWRFPDASTTEAHSIIADLPGTYIIEDLVTEPLYLSAQAPLSESNLAAESEDGFKSLADRLGAQIIRTPQEFAGIETHGGRELWRWFLIGLLLLLFGELLLQRHLSGVSA